MALLKNASNYSHLRGLIKTRHVASGFSINGRHRIGLLPRWSSFSTSTSGARPTGLPAGAWDSHVHVVDEARYPFPRDAPYRPEKAELEKWMSFEKSLGIDHVCLVSLSVYGNDNSLLLESLKRLNGKGRGVVGIDPTNVTDEDLASMHQVGVRGARLNLRSHGRELDKEEFEHTLKVYADRLRPLGWVLQVYVGMGQLPLFADVIPKLGIRVVIDHLGHPEHPEKSPLEQKGSKEFLTLLRTKHVYTKLSGIDRFPTTPGVDSFAQRILEVAPTQVVWASDWPHTGGKNANPDGDPTKHQKYRQVDDLAFLRKCMSWCDETLMHKVWVANPRRLWQYGGDKQDD